MKGKYNKLQRTHPFILWFLKLKYLTNLVKIRHNFNKRFNFSLKFIHKYLAINIVVRFQIEVHTTNAKREMRGAVKDMSNAIHDLN